MTNQPLDPASFDDRVDPAVDFYRHVNGRWLEENPVPPEYGSWGAFHEVQVRNEELLHDLMRRAAETTGPEGSAGQMVGDYYRSGMDEEQIAAAGAGPLRPLVEVIDEMEGPDDLWRVASRLHLQGARFLFGASVFPDFDDSTRHLLYVGQGGLGLPERDYYTRADETSVAVRNAYRAHIAAQLGNLGYDAEAAEATSAAILEFETALAEASYTAAQLRDVDLVLNKHSTGELDAMGPGLGIVRYLEAIGTTASTVSVDNPGFFGQAAQLVSDTPLEVLQGYARWHLVRSFASSLPPAFEDEAFEFYGRTLGGQQEQKPRWKRVLAAASADIGELVGRLYVEAAFGPEAKERAVEMVEHLLAAMGRSIRNLDWMSEDTKERALEKLAGFSYKIGYPDRWRSYDGLTIDRGPFATNRMRAAAFEVRRRLDKLGKPVDRDEWEMAPHVVNAYYHPLQNEIVFPAGILQPPFFYADADDAVNYGGIGSVIGHEITHGFDDVGRRFDADGRLQDWWSEADRREFERRSGVVVEQFDAYPVDGTLTVNGTLTLGENIADLGGVAIAFAALSEVLAESPQAVVDGMTPQQRFFASYATVWRRNYSDEFLRLLVTSDPHSPSHYRCNGPLSNFAPFAAAFDIGDDAPMMRPPDERVAIW